MILTSPVVRSTNWGDILVQLYNNYKQAFLFICSSSFSFACALYYNIIPRGLSFDLLDLSFTVSQDCTKDEMPQVEKICGIMKSAMHKPIQTISPSKIPSFWKVDTILSVPAYQQHFSEETDQWNLMTTKQIDTFVRPNWRKEFTCGTYGQISLEGLSTFMSSKKHPPRMSIRFDFVVYKSDGQILWPI